LARTIVFDFAFAALCPHAHDAPVAISSPVNACAAIQRMKCKGKPSSIGEDRNAAGQKSAYLIFSTNRTFRDPNNRAQKNRFNFNIRDSNPYQSKVAATVEAASRNATTARFPAIPYRSIRASNQPK